MSKTKKQPQPIGRVMWANSGALENGYACFCENQILLAFRRFLVIPMTRGGKCQRARVVDSPNSVRAKPPPTAESSPMLFCPNIQAQT